MVEPKLIFTLKFLFLYKFIKYIEIWKWVEVFRINVVKNYNFIKKNFSYLTNFKSSNFYMIKTFLNTKIDILVFLFNIMSKPLCMITSVHNFDNKNNNHDNMLMFHDTLSIINCLIISNLVYIILNNGLITNRIMSIIYAI